MIGTEYYDKTVDVREQQTSFEFGEFYLGRHSVPQIHLEADMVKGNIGCRYNGKLCPICNRIHPDRTGKNNSSFIAGVKEKQRKARILFHKEHPDFIKGKNNPMKDKEVAKRAGQTLSKNRTGKTWEDRFGFKKAKELKRQRSINNPMKIEKIRRERSIKYIGKNNPNFKGWISRFPYGKDWTFELKKAIAERDNCICQVCGKKTIEGCPHHINYNKEDCNKINLVWTHRGCNSHMNGNRDYWFAYFCYQQNIEPEEQLKGGKGNEI